VGVARRRALRVVDRWSFITKGGFNTLSSYASRKTVSLPLATLQSARVPDRGDPLLRRRGGWIASAQKQRRTVEQFRKSSGNWVDYAHQDKAPRDLNDPYYSTTHSWAPDFLYNAMGPDYFHRVTGARLNLLQNEKADSIRLCKSLTHLKRSELYRYDHGDQPILLDLITELDTLEELTVSVPADWLTKERINRLAQFKHLSKLSLFVVSNQPSNRPEIIHRSFNSYDSLNSFDLSLLARLDRLDELCLGFASNTEWLFPHEFVRKNSKLTKLTIQDDALADYACKHFVEIAKCCLSLEVLSIRIGSDVRSFAPLAQLKKLSVIMLDGGSHLGQFDQQIEQVKRELPNIGVFDVTEYRAGWPKHFR
jgi:hypothetical protein